MGQAPFLVMENKETNVMYQLPSGDFSPPFAAKPQAAGAPKIMALVVIWLMLAIGYFGYRALREPKRAAPPPPPPPPSAPARPAVNPLAVAHATNALGAALRAETELRQAEAEVRRTMTLTDSLVETRHLHVALANLEAARQGLEQNRYDIDSLESLLKGENQP